MAGKQPQRREPKKQRKTTKRKPMVTPPIVGDAQPGRCTCSSAAFRPSKSSTNLCTACGRLR